MAQETGNNMSIFQDKQGKKKSLEDICTLFFKDLQNLFKQKDDSSANYDWHTIITTMFSTKKWVVGWLVGWFSKMPTLVELFNASNPVSSSSL